MDYILSILHIYSKFGPTSRSLVKSILRLITGKCELERICEMKFNGEVIYGYKQCCEVENSLYCSKNDAIRKILVSDKMKTKTAMETIMRVKRIIPEKNETFVKSMPYLLCKIISYNALFNEVDLIRSIQYDETNDEHENSLKKLWCLIKKDDELNERHTSRWNEIGFQGTNPATDFRGMGILGLKNMIYLLEKKETIGMKIYGQSNHPQYGFSFAIMAINFTSTCFDLLRSGRLKGYIYNLQEVDYSLESFQLFFTEIFEEFSDYWVMRRPPNIMSFSEIKKDYMIEVERRLNTGKW